MGSPRTNTKNAIVGNARAPLPTLFYWRVRPEVNIGNSSRVVMLLRGAGMASQNAPASSLLGKNAVNLKAEVWGRSPPCQPIPNLIFIKKYYIIFM